MALFTGFVQRSHLKVVQCIHIRTGLDKESQDINVVVLRCDVYGLIAIVASSIEKGFVFEQKLDNREMAVLSSFFK